MYVIIKLVIIMKIIKIGALWCPACLITNKSLKKITEEYDNIEVISYDYDLDEDIVKKYNVGEVLPVLIFETEEKELGRLIGEKSYKEIKVKLDEVLQENN